VKRENKEQWTPAVQGKLVELMSAEPAPAAASGETSAAVETPEAASGETPAALETPAAASEGTPAAATVETPLAAAEETPAAAVLETPPASKASKWASSSTAISLVKYLCKDLHSDIRWDKRDKVAERLRKEPNAVNEPDPGNGNTAIHIAAQNGHTDMSALLIRAGSDVNKQNSGGQTALHMAMSYDMLNIVELLKDAGADGSIRNVDGHAANDGLGGEKNPASGEFKLQTLREATMEGEFVSALEDLTAFFRISLVLGDASLEKSKVVQVGERSLIVA